MSLHTSPRPPPPRSPGRELRPASLSARPAGAPDAATYEALLEEKILEMQRQLERLEAQNPMSFHAADDGLTLGGGGDFRVGGHWAPRRGGGGGGGAGGGEFRGAAATEQHHQHHHRPHTSPDGSPTHPRRAASPPLGSRPVTRHTARDVATPAWSSVSWRSTCSVRIQELSEPRSVAAKYRKDKLPFGPLPPISAWGRDHHRAMLANPQRLAELTAPRSTDPAHWERPVVVTSPRLSAKFRVPGYFPPSSKRGSSPERTCPPSPRSPRTHLNHSITPAVIEAEPLGKRLYDASRRGNVELTRRLIKMKADVNFRGEKFGNTALMDAANRGHLNAVRALIAGGASVDACDKFGSTALHYASKAGELTICGILIAAGAEHSIPNKHGKTPLDLGRGNSNVVVFLEMLSKAEVCVRARGAAGSPGKLTELSLDPAGFPAKWGGAVGGKGQEGGGRLRFPAKEGGAGGEGQERGGQLRFEDGTRARAIHLRGVCLLHTCCSLASRARRLPPAAHHHLTF